MSNMSIAERSLQGVYAGTGLAVVPAAVTLLIASSRIIVVDIIAKSIIKILTAGKFTAHVYGVSLIKVPLLWKISMISAMIGGGIVALSLTAALINLAYLRMQQNRASNN